MYHTLFPPPQQQSEQPVAKRSEKKELTLAEFESLVEAGEQAQATLDVLPEDAAAGYLPGLTRLNKLIEEGKKKFENKA